MPFLLNLKEKRIVDDIIEYVVNEHDSPQDGIHFERSDVAKKNMGLELARLKGCTHFTSLDTDEFYTKAEFEYMKTEMRRL